MDVNNNTGNGSFNNNNNNDPERLMKFNPIMDNNNVNLSDPEELEAHMQVQDVRERLRARRRKMIRIFTVVAVLAIVAFLVGLGMSETFKSSSSTTTSLDTDGSNSGGGLDTVLPPPPADLATTCSAMALTTPEAIALCEADCEVADCCNVPTGYALSCQANNPVVCTEYQRYCDVLYTVPASDPGNAVPPAAGEVAGTTDGTSVSTTPGTTPVTQPATNPDVTVPAATPVGGTEPANTALTLQEQIQQACTNLVEAVIPPGSASCEDLCGTSFCCFNHYCVPPLDMECLDYQGCFVLYADLDEQVDDDDTTTNPDGTPTLAEEIHRACFAAETINDAVASTECSTLCAPGACCFETSMECSNVDCKEYAECNILYPSFISVTKQEVDDACNNPNDTSSPTLCEKICELHVMQCCFHENYKDADCDNVLQQPGSAYCDTYQSCAVLGTAASELRQSHKDELQKACSDQKTRGHCIRLCSVATCCYATSVPEECANVGSTVTCTDYEPCDVLYNA